MSEMKLFDFYPVNGISPLYSAQLAKAMVQRPGNVSELPVELVKNRGARFGMGLMASVFLISFSSDSVYNQLGGLQHQVSIGSNIEREYCRTKNGIK